MTTQSDWIEWKGGECPVPDQTKVSVLFRNGSIDYVGSAGIWLWEWQPGQPPNTGDIVGYRVLDAKAGDRS